MEEKANVWKANLTNGVILALEGVVFMLILFFFNQTLNRSISYLNVPIQLILLFYLLKSYRDNYMHGQITFGQSVGAGMVMFVYYAIIMAAFTYVLWAVIDPGLAKKSLAIAEEAMTKKGANQAAIDAGLAFTAKLMKPSIMAVTSILGSLFIGIIYSLLVSIFIKKEGNPLIDVPEN